MPLGQTPPLLVLELAAVLGMTETSLTHLVDTLSAVAPIPQREQLLSKGLRDPCVGGTGERVPLCTQGSSTLGSAAATKAAIKCERQRKVMALALF